MLSALAIEGVDVFRLNFSHGTHDDHQKVIDFVREINEELGTHIALLQDLQGPKIRVNEMEPGVPKLKQVI
ncbi:MAG: pyruvate kinase [Cytophagales bacterium]|nr:pyruvate kinase [Cytophagales bacterium]